MTERPMLFNAEMVRAVLDGRKTQTRRPFKPQGGRLWEYSHDLRVPMYQGDGRYEMFPAPCPYGAVGDRLWVRETWAHYQTVGPGGEVSDGRAGYRADGFDGIEDFRDYTKTEAEGEAEYVIINGDHWRPSIHMPRWASRITLEVTGVRVERVQSIRGSDAVAEGAPVPTNGIGEAVPCPIEDWFRPLWDSVYTKRGLGWSVNPWVWVVEFRVVTP